MKVQIYCYPCAKAIANGELPIMFSFLASLPAVMRLIAQIVAPAMHA